MAIKDLFTVVAAARLLAAVSVDAQVEEVANEVDDTIPEHLQAETETSSEELCNPSKRIAAVCNFKSALKKREEGNINKDVDESTLMDLKRLLMEAKHLCCRPWTTLRTPGGWDKVKRTISMRQGAIGRQQLGIRAQSRYQSSVCRTLLCTGDVYITISYYVLMLCCAYTLLAIGGCIVWLWNQKCKRNVLLDSTSWHVGTTGPPPVI